MKTSWGFCKFYVGVDIVLTESEVQRSFQRLFKGGEISTDALEKAEELIEELRLESPLRHRLTDELDQLRSLSTADNR